MNRERKKMLLISREPTAGFTISTSSEVSRSLGCKIGLIRVQLQSNTVYNIMGQRTSLLFKVAGKV